MAGTKEIAPSLSTTASHLYWDSKPLVMNLWQQELEEFCHRISERLAVESQEGAAARDLMDGVAELCEVRE